MQLKLIMGWYIHLKLQRRTLKNYPIKKLISCLNSFIPLSYVLHFKPSLYVLMWVNHCSCSTVNLFCQGRSIFLCVTGRICCWSTISKFRASCGRDFTHHTFNIFILKGITSFIILIFSHCGLLFLCYLHISGRVMSYNSLNASINLSCTMFMCICSNNCTMLAYCQLWFYIKITPTLWTRWWFSFKHFGCL